MNRNTSNTSDISKNTHLRTDSLLGGARAGNFAGTRRMLLAGTVAGMATMGGLLALAPAAQAAGVADAAEQLRSFVRDVKAGRAGFTQVVSSPDGKRQKTSSGNFEFQRPNRFRFTYLKPYAQTIVSDGSKVWFHDPDLNQVTVRKFGDALGATPASLLAASSLDKDFELKTEPDRDGLAWVQALPRQREGSIQWLKVGFRGGVLAALEIADSFGQRTMLRLSGFTPEVVLPAETFRFVVPAGADVSEQ